MRSYINYVSSRGLAHQASFAQHLEVFIMDTQTKSEFPKYLYWSDYIALSLLLVE